MVRVAVAGLGFMGKTHLGIYNSLDNVEIAALCDIQEELLYMKSLDAGGNIEASSGDIDLSGAEKFTDFDTLIEAGGYDFVDLCLPTFLHADYAVKALKKGFHVFCEKPMALSREETKKILDAVEETGKLLSVGQCLRFWPAYVEIKKIIDSGKYGNVRYADFGRFSAPPTWGWEDWLTDTKRSGNAALDLHVHDVDMVLYMFGKPKSVSSTGVKEADGGISHIATVYTYDDLSVSATGGWIASDSFAFNMRAFFILENATIEMDFSKDPIVMVCPVGGEKYPIELPEGDGYFYELKDFTEGIEKGALSGVVTGKSAAEAVDVTLSEIESAEKGKTIDIG